MRTLSAGFDTMSGAVNQPGDARRRITKLRLATLCEGLDMRRFVIPALAVLGILFLSGCLPTPDPESPVSSDPVPSVSPTPAESPAEEPLPEIVLPACDALYSTDQVASLMGEGMELIGDATTPESDGGFGTSIPELKALLRSGDAVNCTWILPFTERGLTVSLMVVDSSTLGQINTALDAAGAGTTPVGGDTVIRAFAVDGEYPFSEAHGLGGTVWVSAYDGFGESAPALVQAAFESVIALNPGRF